MQQGARWCWGNPIVLGLLAPTLDPSHKEEGDD